MGTNEIWFDSEGKAAFWKNVPMRTVKKALFTKGSAVRSLAKLVVNGITYDFNKTAQGGAVIVPPDFSAIEFISPDGRIDYKTLFGGSLGNALSTSIAVLESKPVPAWDNFAGWIGANGTIGSVANQVTGCNIQTIGGGSAVAVDVPNFVGVTNMAEFLGEVYVATEAAHGNALSMYQLDEASFGWEIQLITNGTVKMSIGFIFRE